MSDPFSRCRRWAALANAAAMTALAATSFAASAQSLPKIKLPSLPGGDRAAAQAPGGDAASQRKEQRRQADLVEAVFDEIRAFVPDHRAFVADNDQAQADAMQAIDQFQQRMGEAINAELIAMANDASNSYAVRTRTSADRYADSLLRTIQAIDLDKFRNSQGRDDLAIAQYFLMAFRAEQLDQLARLYPDSQSVAGSRKVASAAMTELGSLESVMQGRAAAQAARVAAMRLYPAVRSDPATERDFASAFKASVWTQDEFAGSDVVKVNILTAGWTVRRNPITGIILSRDQRANLAVRRKDGKCFSYVVEFEQKSQGGGSFGRTYMASGRDLEMLCENI